MSNPNPRRYTR